MSDHKISGGCTTCDALCFQVLDLTDAGEPKRFGPPLDGAVRISFMLYDGSRADLTFCGGCATKLVSPDYFDIWAKVIRSWVKELSGKPVEDQNPEWFPKQFANGLLVEMGRKSWKDLVNG